MWQALLGSLLGGDGEKPGAESDPAQKPVPDLMGLFNNIGSKNGITNNMSGLLGLEPNSQMEGILGSLVQQNLAASQDRKSQQQQQLQEVPDLMSLFQ